MVGELHRGTSNTLADHSSRCAAIVWTALPDLPNPLQLLPDDTLGSPRSNLPVPIDFQAIELLEPASVLTGYTAAQNLFQ